MNNFFIILATTALVSAVDIAKVQQVNTDSEMNLAQVTRGRLSIGGRTSTSVGTTSSTYTAPITPHRGVSITSTVSQPIVRAPIEVQRPTATSVTRPSVTTVTRPTSQSVPNNASSKRDSGISLTSAANDITSQRSSISSRQSVSFLSGTRPSISQLNVPSSQRPRTSSTSGVGAANLALLGTGLPRRSFASTTRSQASQKSGAPNDPEQAVGQKSWNMAETLVVATTALQLPAMIGEMINSRIMADQQMELAREQFDANYELAEEQNDQAEAAYLEQQLLVAEAAAADAKAAEIAAIWRSQQAVVDELNELYVQANWDSYVADYWYYQDLIDTLEANCPTTETAGCENVYNDIKALEEEQDAVNPELIEQDLLELQDKLAEMELEFCLDEPGDFATDCLAVL